MINGDLDALDRAHLVSTLGTDGFKVIQSIMEEEVEKFRVALLNADPSDERKVISAHYLAKAAAQFYQGIVNRINAEADLYINAPRASDRPLDVTANLNLDLEGATEGIQNLFGGD